MRYRFSIFLLEQNIFGSLFLHRRVLDALRIQMLRGTFLRQDSGFGLVNDRYLDLLDAQSRPSTQALLSLLAQ